MSIKPKPNFSIHISPESLRSFQTASKQTPTPAPVKDTLRMAANEGSIDCFTDLIRKIVEFFTSLFTFDSPINEERFKKWDALVEKEYDPAGADRNKAGHTLADHFVKAVSKTDLDPSLQHVFAYIKSGAGIIFSFDGAYTTYSERAKRGEFDNPKTLIVIGLQEDMTAKKRQDWLQGRIQNSLSEGYKIQNAKVAVLSRDETRTLLSDRMPASLLQVLKEQR